MHPVTPATIQALRAFVFPAYGRKSKPPASRVVVDSSEISFRAAHYKISNICTKSTQVDKYMHSYQYLLLSPSSDTDHSVLFFGLWTEVCKDSESVS